MKISEILTSMSRGISNRNGPEEPTASVSTPGQATTEDALKQDTKGLSVENGNPELRAATTVAVDQKTLELVAERDRALKLVAEARVMRREARDAREKEYPGDPMRYFYEKLEPSLEDAGSRWDEMVRIPIGTKKKE